MKNANIEGKLSSFIYSEYERRLAMAGILSFGFILVILSFLRDFGFNQFAIALGVSLVIGTSIGGLAGDMIGWPLGLWIGLCGGLIVAPIVAIFVGDVVSAYYASFLGPIVGALIGRWNEIEDKKRLKEDMESIVK
ncbi:MAG: hypothetical protein ACOCSJ_02720 [Candidatus Natronoplasma sp.]